MQWFIILGIVYGDALSKAQVCSCLVAGIAGSNSADGCLSLVFIFFPCK
jgi:hypothetical protein